MPTPVFVAFEGGEGSGKTLQAASLHGRFSRAGYRAVLVYEPGITPLGEHLRRYVKSRKPLTPRAEILLFAAARAELVERVIVPSLKRGVNVVADRYAYSSMAYQGYGRWLSKRAIQYVNRFATKEIVPDLVILLDIPPEEGLRRLTARQVELASRGQELRELEGRPDEEERRKFEQLSLDFHNRVREGYLKLAAQDFHRWLVVDAKLPPEQISDIVWNRVSSLLSQVGDVDEHPLSLF